MRYIFVPSINKQKHKTMTNYLRFTLDHEEMEGLTTDEILDLVRSTKDLKWLLKHNAL